jgi:ribosomal protein L29
MSAFQIIPKEVEQAFGSEGTEKFVLFLNQGFENQKTNVLQIVNDSFHDHVTMEVSRVRLEVAELRTELKSDIAHVDNKVSELRADMAELRTELKSDIAHVDNKVSELRADMAELRTELKSDIAHVDNKISELRADMAELRTELKSDIANLRADSKADNADLHKAISDVQKTIAGQTKWLLVILLAGVTLYPIAVKIVDRVFPEPKSPVIIQNSPAQE